MAKSNRTLFRVKFIDKEEKHPIEVVVSNVGPSEFFGLVALEGFIFSDRTRFVILPDEDAAAKRFGRTERLHIPYHNIVFVEEFTENPVDLRRLPFMKEVPNDGTQAAPKEASRPSIVVATEEEEVEKGSGTPRPTTILPTGATAPERPSPIPP